MVCREYKIRPVGGVVELCRTSRSVKGGGGSSGAPEGSFDGSFAVNVQFGCWSGSFKASGAGSGSGILLRRSFEDIEDVFPGALRNDPFTLEKEGLTKAGDCCFCVSVDDLDKELDTDSSRALCLRPFRWPTFSTVSSIHDRSALNMVAVIEVGKRRQVVG